MVELYLSQKKKFISHGPLMFPKVGDLKRFKFPMLACFS